MPLVRKKYTESYERCAATKLTASCKKKHGLIFR